jgi:hypothetical protein
MLSEVKTAKLGGHFVYHAAISESEVEVSLCVVVVVISPVDKENQLLSISYAPLASFHASATKTAFIMMMMMTTVIQTTLKP